MSLCPRFPLSLVLLGACAAVASAQTLPTSQPGLISIDIEEVKLSDWVEHVTNENGWPIALERANSAFPYIALEAMTGTPEVWFVSPYDSHAKLAESVDEGDDALDAELARLRRADVEHLEGFRRIHAVGRKDLSHGAFPETAKQRFYEVTTFRVRPGGEAAFEAAAKAYGASAGRSAPEVAYRVYEVIAGMPGPTYLVFASTTSLADFDKVMADGMAAMKGMNAQEQEAIAKFNEHLINVQTNRFRLHPTMSYVPKAVREQDPAFWMPKK